jgi:Electron transfer DM13
VKTLKLAIPLLIVALIAGWYWFRPERLVVNRRVDEAFPTLNESSAQILGAGNFHSGTHPTQGTATIYRIENGSRVLRFANFKTSNGPDVHIYMVASEDARDDATVQNSAFVDLGLIKGNSATKTTLSTPVSTWRNTVRCRCGANGLVKISAPHH